MSADHRIAPARFRPCVHPVRVHARVERKQFQDGQETREQLYVSCGVCETCIHRRIADVTGRAMAESLGADQAYMVTLTFGGDKYYGSTANNPRANTLDASLVRSFIKRLRANMVFDAFGVHKTNGGDRHNFVAPRMRFIFAGELGPMKGRVHYHLIVYFYDGGPPDLPEWAIGRDVFHGAMHSSVDLSDFPQIETEHKREYWPWGFSNWEPFHASHPKYIAKYVVKSAGERLGEETAFKVIMPGRSTRPMLGATFFEWNAGRYVDAQLPFNSRKYEMPYEVDRTQKEYFMNDAALMLSIRSYERQWQERALADPDFARYPLWSVLQERYHAAEYKRLEDKRLHELEAEEAKAFRKTFERGLARRIERQLKLGLEVPLPPFDGFGGEFISWQIRNHRLKMEGEGSRTRVVNEYMNVTRGRDFGHILAV